MEPPDVSKAPPPVVRGEPVEVAGGVFVIPDNRVPLVPNVGIAVGDRAALVIDTGLGPRNGAHVLDQARRLAGDRPLYLTMTHFHPEHGYGAQTFAGAAADDAVTAIDKEARTRWSDWANPEWIAFAARTFYDRAAAASP